MPAQDGFWRFTLELYSHDGVKPAALRLQDKCGADVNLLFFCCFVAASDRGHLTREQLAQADRALLAWREQVTLPLRDIRDAIKNSSALRSLAGALDTRTKVLAAEVESERVAQVTLESLAPAPMPAGRTCEKRLTDAAASLRVYFEYLDVVLDDDDRQAVRTLLKGTFPDSPPTG